MCKFSKYFRIIELYAEIRDLNQSPDIYENCNFWQLSKKGLPKIVVTENTSCRILSYPPVIEIFGYLEYFQLCWRAGELG